MNRHQVVKQLVFLLASAVWPTPDDSSDTLYGQSGDLVFPKGSVVVSTQPPESFATALAHPYAVVRPLEGDVDRDAGGRFSSARFTITVVARGTGDRFGQAPVIGANRPSQARSDGRGEEELVEVVAGALGATAGRLVDSSSGIQGTATRVGASRQVGRLSELAAFDFDVNAFNVTTARTYHQPRQFQATPGAPGAATFSWVNAPLRWDTLRNVLRRSSAPGGAAPATPSDGEAIAVTGGDLGASASVTGLASGSYPVALFAIYDETGTRSAQRFSPPVPRTVAIA